MATHPLIHVGLLLAMVLLPEFLGAVPLELHKQDQASDHVKANLQKLVRHKRNMPVMAAPQFKPDFWGWYKYFMDSHNQEGVEDLDRVYLAYLQNKHRSEEGPTFNHYLKHLSEIYKACADSEDPECIAESTSKPKAAMVMPAPIRSAAVRMCNPHVDPYCLFPLAPKSAGPEPELAPAKEPAPIRRPIMPMPMKSPVGYYYAPVLESFLSHEQKAELLRICNHEDVECLQYHLRAAYGYRPAAAPAPSYSALGCDPNDPYCMPIMVQKAPTGFYHLLYPSCDPTVDPMCVGNGAAPSNLGADSGVPQEQHCNPLFDAGCNPLSATKLSGLTKPVLQYAPKDHPAHVAAPMACDPRYDPYCIPAAAAVLGKTRPQLPEHQVRYKVGIRGKTREGHDCYVHYDKDCTPLESRPKAKSDIQAPAEPLCHPYDPNCAKFAAPPAMRAQKSGTGTGTGTGTGGIIFPDPDCDPEIDYNCRLRHADTAAEEKTVVKPAKKSMKAVVSFEDFLLGFMSQHK
ncbi:actinodin2 [Entelurus aequoreus]|uniref:actinodin2 n=1 Tax=Entelurus aequoreus TaxID=161455 RepID=UPI002B1D3527|nr:actinodin2 [Entelurus aequoreus]